MNVHRYGFTAPLVAARLRLSAMLSEATEVSLLRVDMSNKEARNAAIYHGRLMFVVIATDAGYGPNIIGTALGGVTAHMASKMERRGRDLLRWPNP